MGKFGDTISPCIWFWMRLSVHVNWRKSFMPEPYLKKSLLNHETCSANFSRKMFILGMHMNVYSSKSAYFSTQSLISSCVKTRSQLSRPEQLCETIFVGWRHSIALFICISIRDYLCYVFCNGLKCVLTVYLCSQPFWVANMNSSLTTTT